MKAAIYLVGIGLLLNLGSSALCIGKEDRLQEMNMYVKSIDYIRSDTIAREAMNCLFPVPIHVLDTVGCSEFRVDWFDEIVEYLYPNRGDYGGILDSLSRLPMPCSKSADPRLPGLSSSQDDAISLLFMKVDSISAKGKYLLPVYLFKDFSISYDDGVLRYYYSEAVFYWFIFNDKYEIDKVFGYIERK